MTTTMCAVDAGRPPLCTPTSVTTPVCFAPTGVQACPQPGFQRTTIDAECARVVTQFDSEMVALQPPLLELAPCPDQVQVCGVVETVFAPVSLTITGQDCTGAAAPVTSEVGRLTEIVQRPGQALTVRLCEPSKDFETVLLCGPAGERVLAISDVTFPAMVVTTYWDLIAGADWVGDPATLTVCPDSDVESDPALMCDGSTQFWRWVVKKDGQPTGVVYDTDLTGAPYAPGGMATAGTCTANRDARVYYREVGAGATLTMADIVAATGAASVQAVQAGIGSADATGKLVGDLGEIPIDSFTTSVAHNAITGSDAQDSLTNSAWAVSVFTGVIRVSAMYYL